MPDFSDITVVNTLLAEAQEADRDNRERVREVEHFLKKDDGQWEPEIIHKFRDRPRYTFDKCNPVVDSIAGEIEQADFSMKVRPAGGDASKETALLYDGMIRNIRNISNGDHIFDHQTRKAVEAGFGGWRVVHEYASEDSFDQDLLIKKIANPVDSLWLDPGAYEQDGSDANYGFVLEPLTEREYKQKYPEGSGVSISVDKSFDVYYQKGRTIVIGEVLYKKTTTEEIVLMSDDSVYVVDEKFEQVQDDLAAQGVTEVRRKKKKISRFYNRLFDGKNWLNEEMETVFSTIPLIPIYANFDVSENKVIYRGAVNKLMDAQRVFNYTESRKVEEGALSPRPKLIMTREQAQNASDRADLQTLNTNAKPVQFYTHVENQPPPFILNPAPINPGLQLMSDSMQQNIIQSSGIFAANQGDAPRQSGVAIELQQNKGDNSTIKYFNSKEIALCRTATILIDAIPRTYDRKRTIRVIGEDGQSKMETINDVVFDQQTGELVELNDVRKGKYDVTCDVGPAFKNRQQETARAFLEAAGVDPTLLPMAKDVWLNNLNVPGFDSIAERARKQLLESGMIPDSQMTDEEKEFMQARISEMEAQIAAQQQQGPSVMDMAVIEQTQANTADIASRAAERQAKIQSMQQKGALEVAKFQQQTNNDQMQMLMDGMKQVVDSLNTQADTLKTLKEAMGVDAIVGPGNTEAYIEQTELVTDAQDRVERFRRQ